MKLASLAFAQVVAFIQNLAEDELALYELERLETLLDSVTNQSATSNVNTVALGDLIRAVSRGEKIPAIKAYRMLTSFGLKEAKDAVEDAMTTALPAGESAVSIKNRMLNIIDRYQNPDDDTIGESFLLRDLSDQQLGQVKDFIRSFFS